MGLPVRKENRLRGYDYDSPGAYFITICTRDRRCILSKIEASPPGNTVGAIHESPAPIPVLSPEGECVSRIIRTLPDRFPEISIDRYVIMPNHIHILMRIKSERAIRESPAKKRRHHRMPPRCYFRLPRYPSSRREAATASTLARCFFSLFPAAWRIAWASTVLRRSSHSVTGRPDSFSSSAAN